MNEEKGLTTYVSESRSVHDFKAWAGVVAGTAVLGIVGYAVYLVRDLLPFLGVAVLAAIGLMLIIGLVAAIAWLLHYIFKSTAHDIGEFGTVFQWFGQRVQYAPMTTNTVKITQRKAKVTVTPDVPTIMEMIETGVITPGQMLMHMGFVMGKGGLIPELDKWPGTFAVAGMGRSGKTRRVISIVYQALIGGARVIICDPHATKPDGLARELAPLAPWLILVRGAENCAAAARTFRTEMKRRVKETQEGEMLQPWLIIFDEWSALMTDRDLPDEDKEVMVEVVEDCSTAYAGYQGFSGIIGQKWLDKECGGTTIRRSLHKVFVHKIHPDYAKWFLPARYAKKTDELLVKESFYQDSKAEIKKVISIEVPDEAGEWFADWMREHMPVEAQLPTIEGKRPLIEQRAQHVNPSPSSDNKVFELAGPNTDELMNGVNPLDKPVQDNEPVTVEGEGFITEMKASYTPAEEVQILLAANQIMQENAGKVSRKQIMERLGWTRAKWATIKAVCDTNKIAMI